MSDENRGIVCLIFGALVFFCLAGYFERTVPPQTNLVCNDGWESGSIGRQGACSHHGGVQQMTPHDHAIAHNKWVYFFSGIGGLFAAAQLSIFFGKREYKKLKEKFGESDADKEEVLKTAIRWHRAVAFDYQKSNGPLEQRHIKPKRFVTYRMKHGEGQKCIQGHCLTRDAERTFALERMKNVRFD